MSSLDNMATVMVEDNSSKAEHVQEFLRHSNLIEQEASEEAFEDACWAWDYIMSKKELNYKTVLDIHRILLRRINPDIAGRFRSCDVFIGGKRKKYTDESLLLWELGTVLNGMWLSLQDQTKTRIPFRLAAKCHVMFEEVHPFEDGNGRVGRILYNWHRLMLNLPIHIIHIGEEQRSYYDWFVTGV